MRTPLNVMVPDVVIGLPENDNPVVPPDAPTEVTVPPVPGFDHVGTPPTDVST